VKTCQQKLNVPAGSLRVVFITGIPIPFMQTRHSDRLLIPPSPATIREGGWGGGGGGGGESGICSRRESALVRAKTGRDLHKHTQKSISTQLARDCFPKVFQTPKEAEDTLKNYEYFYLKRRCPPLDPTCDPSPYVSLGISKEKWGYTLWNVCTAPESRKQGCAQALIRRTLQAWRRRWVKEQPASRKPPAFIYLVVMKDNVSAKSVYDKLGFTVVKVAPPHPASLPKHAWLMRASVTKLIEKPAVRAVPPAATVPAPTTATTTRTTTTTSKKKKGATSETTTTPKTSDNTKKKKKTAVTVVERSKTGGGKYKVLDFMATWCGPCKELGPVLKRLAAERGIALEVIDIDKQDKRATRFGVDSVPTVHIVRADDASEESVDSFEGRLSESQVARFLDRYV
jgi:ribosomal protein S18 acetylase RimI-like enzyme/thiol-disulfide isomerase/thioredoxin